MHKWERLRETVFIPKIDSFAPWLTLLILPVALRYVACSLLLRTVSNKLFLMAIFSLYVALTIPEYKMDILKQVLVLRIPHLPGLWHLTMVYYRINQSDNLLFQFSWTYLCLWKTPFTFTVYLQEVRKRDDWLKQLSYHCLRKNFNIWNKISLYCSLK